jgi:ethanolamine-phosphate cytidylyltransferase
MVRACKWADEVVVGVEYFVTVEIIDRMGCDYCIHGDDIAIRKDTGTDAYAEVRAAGKLRIVKRTEGISTTDMVGKMLLMTQNEQPAQDQTAISSLINKKEVNYLQFTRRIA